MAGNGKQKKKDMYNIQRKVSCYNLERARKQVCSVSLNCKALAYNEATISVAQMQLGRQVLILATMNVSELHGSKLVSS